jgi:hypothetical protein
MPISIHPFIFLDVSIYIRLQVSEHTFMRMYTSIYTFKHVCVYNNINASIQFTVYTYTQDQISTT